MDVGSAVKVTVGTDGGGGAGATEIFTSALRKLVALEHEIL